MMAQVTGLRPGEFIHTFGDAHLYANHLEQADKQLARQPLALPTMTLNPDVKELTELSEWRRIAQVTSDKLGDRKFDCVFIDGDHSAEWVRADYQHAGRRAKVCMIHDIQEPDCPAVVEFWNDLKRTSKKERAEFTDSETENKIQGIGILYDKKEPKT
jgi:hypothetical protein